MASWRESKDGLDAGRPGLTESSPIGLNNLGWPILLPALWAAIGTIVALFVFDDDPRDFVPGSVVPIALWSVLGILGALVSLLGYCGLSVLSWARGRGRKAAGKWRVTSQNFVVALMFFLVLLLAFEGLHSWIGGGGPIKESAMVSRIEQDIDELNRVADLITHGWEAGRRENDRYIVVPNFETRPEEGPNLDLRLALSDAGLESARIQRDPAGAVRLAAFSWGLSIGGHSRGYLRSSRRPSPLVDSVDAYDEDHPREKYMVYRWVRDDWYVYREKW